MSMIPSGCISIQDAINLIGREKFGAAWTEKEHAARAGLITIERHEYEKRTPARSGGGTLPGLHVTVSKASMVKVERRPEDDPGSEIYQAERVARERLDASKEELIRRLEAGEWSAIIVDPWSGQKHESGRSMWRTSFAYRCIEKARAQMPRSTNEGKVYIVAPIKKQQTLITPPPKLGEAYHSPYIKMMLVASRKFQITGTSFPKKEELQAYFETLRLPDGSPISTRMAEAMATLCRPPEAMKGGNKRM